MKNATRFTNPHLYKNTILPWSSKWLTCIGFGTLAMTFASLAMVSAVLVCLQRSRTRRAKNVSSRDVMALIFLGGHPANLTFGTIAVWFGTAQLHEYLPTRTCTNLLVLAVFSQWNIAISTPFVALYYAILLRCINRKNSQPTNRRSGAELDRQSRASMNLNREENEAGTNERNGGNPRFYGHLDGLKLFASGIGVVILVGVVNVMTLVASLYSLLEAEKVVDITSITAQDPPYLQTFCGQFLTNPDLFPRRTVGWIFMISAAITILAIGSLSLELDRRVKRRRRVTHTASPVDTARLRYFTRPPDEGAHFHHYAEPALLPLPHRFGDGGHEVGYEDASDGPPAVVAVEGSRVGMLASDSTGSTGTAITQMPWSDNEFYDAERTRHVVQSPPPPDFDRRASNRRSSRVFQPDAGEHPGPVNATTLRANTLPGNSPILANPNRRSHRPRSFHGTRRTGFQLSNQRRSRNSLDLTKDDVQQSTNENARTDERGIPEHPAVQSSSSSSGSRTGQAALPNENRGEVGERDTDNIWNRLVELVFPHRQSGRNQQRFRHTKVEHVREDILPPARQASPLSQPSRRVSAASASATATGPAVTIPLIVTCNNVCVSGALFVFTYSIVAIYLLMTKSIPVSRDIPARYSFIDKSFEPFVALLLAKATLDSMFCFVAFIAFSPMFSKK